MEGYSGRRYKIGVKLGSAAILVIGALFVAKVIVGANSTFLQTDWIGGISGSGAVHPTNQTGWTYYSAKDANVDTSQAGQIMMTTTSGSVVETTDTDFNAGTKTNVEVSGTGDAAVLKLTAVTNDALRPTLGSWGAAAPLLEQWNTALCYTGSGNYIYAIRGDMTRDFVRYDISTKKWDPLSPTPTVCDGRSKGTYMAYPGSGDYIYCLRGSDSTGFWKYAISADTWTDLSATAPTPAMVGDGGSLVAYDSDTLFATRGDGTRDFWQYTISTNTWSIKSQTSNNIYSGGGLVYPGSGQYLYCARGGYDDFYRYDVTANTWSSTAAVDAPTNWAGNPHIVAGEDGYIYATIGGYWTNFYRYSIAGNSWERLPECPFMVYSGHFMVLVGGASPKIYATAGYYLDTWEMMTFDLTTQRWNTFSGPGREGRRLTGYIATPNYIYGAGSYNNRNFYRFDVANEQWEYLSAMPGDYSSDYPESDNFLWTGSLTTYEDYIYWICKDGVDEGKLYKYSISGGTWTYISTRPDTANMENCDLLYTGSGDYAYVLAAPGTSFYKVHLGTGVWTQLTATPSDIKGYHGICYAEDAGTGYIYVARGYQTYDFYRFDLTAEVWETKASMTNGYIYRPSLYNGATRVLQWDGADTIYTYQGYSNRVSKYTISTNSWTAMNLPNGDDYGAQFYPGSGDTVYYITRNAPYLHKYSRSGGTYTSSGRIGCGSHMVILMPDTAGDVLYIGVDSGWPSFYKYTISTDTWTTRYDYWGGSTSVALESGGETIRVGDYIYALMGEGSCGFHRYDIANDIWQTMQYAPGTVGSGGYLTYPGSGDFIYATRGSYYKDFWKYSITSNAWTALADTPDTIGYGAAMAAPGDGNIYLLRGGNKNNVYKYNIATNAWSNQNNSPQNSRTGTEMIYPGSGSYCYVMLTYDNANYFYAYTYASDTWTQKAAFPRRNRGYPSFTHTGGDYIYCLDGDSTPYLYRYSISGDSWSTLANAPAQITEHGQLEWGGPNYSDFLFAWFADGYDISTRQDGGKYSISADKWDSPPFDNNVLYRRDFGGDPVFTHVYRGGKNYLYVCGYSSYFYRYCIEDNTWEKLANDLGISGDYGGDLHYPGTGDYIYGAGYDRDKDFFRYSIPNNTWESLDPLPDTNLYGLRMAHGNDGYLYVTRGYNSTAFWRYDMANETWYILTSSVPGGVGYGADLEYVSKNNSIYCLRGNNTVNFYKFSVSSQSWSTMADLPTKIYRGGGLAYPGIGDYIYAVEGAGRRFFRYSITNDTWEEIGIVPNGYHSDGDLLYGGDSYIYLLEGRSNGYSYIRRYNVFASGEFTSQVLETGANAGYGTADWTDNADGQATLVKVKIRSSDSPTMTGAPAFGSEYATDGADMSGLSTVTDYHKYIQYKVEFKTLDLATIPELSDITLNYLYYPLEQTLTSSVYDTTELRNRIMDLTWSETIPSGTDVRLQLRTSPDNSTWSSWLGPASGQKVSSDFSTANDYAKNSHVVLDTGAARLAKDLEDYQYKQEVIIDNTGGTTQTNAAVEVVISSGNAPFWSQVQSDGDDVRFYDPATSTKLSYNLNSFDYTNKSAKYWVEIPSLAADEVKTVYMLYGSANAVSEATTVGLTQGIVKAQFYAYSGGSNGNESQLNDLFANNLTTYYGETDLTQIYTSSTSNNNPLGSDDYYVGYFYGWIYAPTDGTYYFGVDGDDAQDFHMDCNFVKEDPGPTLVASYYGSHGFAGNYNNNGSITLTQGYHKFVYRMQEGSGGDGYRLGWQKPGDGSIATITSTYFYAGDVYEGATVYIPVPEESATSPTLGANWPYREVVTLTNDGSALTDYVVRISIDSNHNGFWTHVRQDGVDDGGDIRLVDSDNTTLLAYNRISFDKTAKTATISTKVPSIPNGTKSIYLYYGNAAGTDASDATLALTTDEFTSDTSANYTIVELFNRGTGAGFIWDTVNGELESDTSNDNIALVKGTTFSTVEVETTCYTGDDDGVGVFIRDSGGTYYLANLSTQGTDAIKSTTAGTDVVTDLQATTNNYSSQTSHKIKLTYAGSTFKMYVDDALEATYSASITPDGCGIVSIANSPAAIYEYLSYGVFGDTSIVSFSYPETTNTYSITGSYYTDNPTIQPVIGAFYTNDLESFTETSTKPAGTEAKYQISDNGYEWYWWSGASWDIVTGGYSQANTATEVNTNLAAFQTAHPNGEFLYRAYLHTDSGSNTPSIDQIDVNLVAGLSYYQDYTGGEAINQLHTDAVDDRYVQYKLSLFSSGQDTPILDDLTLEYIKAYLTIVSPVGGEVWDIGSTQYILWDKDGLADVGGVFDETVKIEYSTDGGSTWKTESLSASNTGTYTWTVDDDHTPQARVKITSNGWPVITTESPADFRIVGSVTLTNPTGGERWLVGTTENITWTSTGTMPNVKLEYSVDNGSNWSPVIESEGTVNDGIVDNDGTFTWTIPDQVTATDTCLVRVSDSVDADTVSTLATPFRIIGAIAVTYPTLDAPLTAGATYDVTWTSTGTMSQVDLSYTLDGSTWRDMGGTVDQVTTVTNNDTYSWSVPNILSETCNLKVYYTPDSSVTDTSPNFYIRGFMLSTPNGAEEWELDSTHAITWSSGGTVVLPIMIYLSTDGGTTYGATPITTRYTDTGSYNWTIYSAEYSPSDTCKIKIMDSGNSSDVSDANFRIMPNPAIAVTAPDASSEWMVGTDHNITWTTTGNVSSDLAIEYSIDGGTWTAVSPVPTAQDISNKSYTWTVVDTISTDVKVRIRETTIPTNTDGSPRDTQSYVIGESAVFKITSPTVTITAPTSGTIWVVGDTSRDITWTKVGSLIDPLKLEYSVDGGTEWTLIESFNQSQYDGTYPWTNIPAGAAGSSVLIKITDSRTPTAVTDTSDAIEILAHQRITLTAPTAGETLIQGDGYNITWTWDGQATTSTLVLKFSEDGGSTWPDVPPYRIDDQIPNSPTQYYWVVPEISTTQGKLRIYDANDALVESFSAEFSISLPKIEITAPADGAQWYATGTHNVTWNTIGFVSSNLSIEYSLDGGAWTAVSPAPTSAQISDKSYPWSIPDSVGSTGQIRITDLDRPAVTDTSGTFTVISPTITITSPTGTETGPDAWVVGTDHAITWTSTGGADGAISNLVIQYATNGTWTDIVVIPNGDSRITNDSGSHTWTIPDAVSTTARVKIFDGARTATTATSNNFEIAAPSATITAPNGGESWIIGTNHNITWYSVGAVTEPFKLYYTPDGATWNLIASGEANDGTYDWTVPDDYSPGTAKVKIEDSYTTPRTDESDASFTIALPTIAVDTPTELWSATDTKAITWTSTGTMIGPLQVEWSLDNFTTTNIITSTLANTATSVNWTIPETAVSTTVRTKVTDLGRTLTWGKSDAFTVLPIPVITISDPNAADTGADAWRIGKLYTINWSDNGGAISNNLKLQYSVNASDITPTWTDIATGEANDGTYAWTVPLTASASTDCKVRIYDNVEWKTGTNLTADSATFEIAIPRITITSPAGGEYWAVGDSAPITWTSDGFIFDNLTLQYSLDGGTNYYAIASGEPNDGAYTWTVPDVTSSTAVIKIIDASSNYGGEQVVAVSNVFNIIATPTITVTAPNGGEVYVLGDTMNITWTSQGLQITDVKIEYSSDDFTSAIQTIVDSTTNDGSYTWTIPDTALSGATIKVRISMVGNSSVYDDSDANFRIRGGFTITAPIANQRFIVGKSETVTWTTRGTIANVAVKYTSDSTANPVVWTTITSSVANADSYSFAIPEPRVTTALAKVRIEDATDDTVYAESDAFRADYYTVTWRVLDYDTNAPLKQLAVSDSHWVDQTKTIESPVNHDYPYALYTTFWSKDGYIERALEWTADDDKTVTVALENQLTAMVQWHVALATSYLSTSDTLTATCWLERRGKLIGTVETDLADLQWAKLEVFDGSTSLWSDTQTTHNNKGAYSFSWATTGLEGGKNYFVKASISYRDSVYISGASVDVSISKDLQATRAIVEAEAVKTTAIKTAVESTLPTKIDAKAKEIKDETAKILVDTGTDIPADIASTKTKIATAMKSRILNTRSSLKKGKKLKVRYRTYTGLTGVTIDVYNPDKKQKVSKKTMKEIKTTGIYEYEVEFLKAWGTGNFTIVCSESTYGTMDAMTLTVFKSDLDSISSDVGSVLGLTTSLGDLDTVVDTLDSQISVIEKALKKVSKSLIDEVTQTVESATQLETVFNEIKKVNKAVKSMETATKDMDMDKFYEIAEEEKTDIKYLKNKTQEMRAMMELNQKMIDNVANEPIVQTWYEYRSVVLRAVITNPSPTQVKEVPFKAYLPKEARPEHLMSRGELKTGYDTQLGSYYVHTTFVLQPKEVKEVEIEMKDIWQIKTRELESLRAEARKVYKMLRDTEFADRSEFLLASIEENLDNVIESQKAKPVNPEDHISNYRENLDLMKEAKADLALARTLLSQTQPFSLQATWKLIVAIIVFLGILSLGFYFVWQRQVNLTEVPTIEGQENKKT